jgi:adenylate cyclase class 2
MSTEIELKAHIEDPEAVKARLSSLGTYLGAYEKDDTYWFPGGPSGLPPSGLRVRLEKDRAESGEISEKVLVTWKLREINGGIEINSEQEFTVSGAENFVNLLALVGLEPGTRKHKQGWAWNCLQNETAVRAELSDVYGLGWFLELEIIAGENSGETAVHSGKKLLALLERLGIPEDKIESRPSTRMLSGIGKRRKYQYDSTLRQAP